MTTAASNIPIAGSMGETPRDCILVRSVRQRPILRLAGNTAIAEGVTRRSLCPFAP